MCHFDGEAGRDGAPTSPNFYPNNHADPWPQDEKALRPARAGTQGTAPAAAIAARAAACSWSQKAMVTVQHLGNTAGVESLLHEHQTRPDDVLRPVWAAVYHRGRYHPGAAMPSLTHRTSNAAKCTTALHKTL